MADLPDGWLSAADVGELERLASGKDVLELGAWKGRSTVVLSNVARFVVSVDRHAGIEEVGGEDSLPDYLEAVRGLPNVAIVVASFEDIVPLFTPGRFGLVFIDGDHDLANVQRDIALALLVDPAVVAFHDFDFEDVRMAATQVFGEADSVGGSVASFIRRPI